MTHRIDVARSRDVIARWRDLAEQRLDYLTELFETGRWRRYHSERAFLENIQEAKTAVQAWRDLSAEETPPVSSVTDMSWLSHISATPRAELPDRDDPPSVQPAQIAAEPPPQVSIMLEDEYFASDDEPSAPSVDHVPEAALDIDSIAARYPLLRNAL